MRYCSTFLFFLTMGFSMSSNAQGLYDGIWQLDSTSFATIQQNGTQIISIALDLNTRTFEVSSGNLSGNTVDLTTIVGAGVATNRVTFTSATTLESTLIACTPAAGFTCDVPLGTVFTASRAF